MIYLWSINCFVSPPGLSIFAAMGQKKLLRFNQLRALPNVFEYPKDMAGNWHTVFGNTHPLLLELACGRGEYTIGLADQFPDQNVMGLDVKGNRMYLGARYAAEKPLPNVRFLRTQIEMITDYFLPGEVAELWITFPDPQLRTSRAKKRLTHPRFLRLYQQILQPGGLIHLKTDSPVLYDFTLHVIKRHQLILHSCSHDVYAQPTIDPRLRIQTHYEKLDIAQSNRIHYICFSLTGDLKNDDDQLQKYLKQHEQTTL
jgi:tRNA (guanine-N7-)-methyltransferase